MSAPTETPPANEPAWQVYLDRRVIAMAFLGFSAGLPLLLVGGTFTAWLRDIGVELAAIGFLSWVGMAHSIKVLWAPIVDRVPLPILSRLLGRRRAWVLTAQVVVALSLAGMALVDPGAQLALVAALAVAAAFGSATQDIAIDAYRVEAAERERQGAMAATYVFGYRIAILVAGAGALHIASVGNWNLAYGGMALLMGIGMVTILAVREPHVGITRATAALEQRVADYLGATPHSGWRREATAWFIGAVVCPFADFFKRYGLTAIAVLLFIGTFRISDIFMGVMANPFYLDVGFTKAQIANVAAAFGLAMTLTGAMLGGLLVARYGIARLLIITAIMAPVTNLTFSWVATLGPEVYGLVIAIIADNVTGGMAISVFLAYLASLTNTQYTATQYALFSSLMTLPGQFLGGFTGVVAEQVGWVWFFVIAAGMGLPAVILAVLLLRIAHPDRVERPGQDRGRDDGA